MPAKTSIPKELKLFVTSFEKMLMRIREASENEKQFISNASHELRTPLTLLKSTLQIATVEKRTAEEYESYIQESLEDVDRMADLIEQLLLLAKLGNEEYQLPTETIEICQLLRGVIDSFNNRLQNSSEILFMSSVEACYIQASLQELGRLFSNVIENAIKYGPKGEDITVTVDTDENFLRITINDKGGNIPQENLGKIFDRFYRLDSNRSRNTGGTGLGLAIAKEIAIKNNGKIEAKSTNTEGTDIIIYLPQKKIIY